MSLYNEYAMRARIDECLKTVAVVLDANKSASVAAADKVSSHRYEDKYFLANNVTNTSIVCVLNGLELLGVSRSGLGSLKTWNSRRAVSLKFERKQHCKFVKEIEREEEDPTRTQVDSTMFGRTTVKVITKIKEYIYLIEEEYSLSAHSGVGDNPAEVIHITSGSSQIEATLRSKSPPFTESTLVNFDVNISWLLTHLDEAASTASFAINRAAADCATPRQNHDIATALAFYSSFSSFCGRMHTEMHHLYEVQSRYQAATAAKFAIEAVGPEGIFNPIVPLFEDHEATPAPTETPDTEMVTTEGSEALVTAPAAPESVALSAPVVNRLVEEQRRSLAAKCAQVASLFVSSTASPTGGAAERRSGVFNAAEATLMVVLIHLTEFAGLYKEAVDFIEHMIRSQLVAAVGKELTARDFAQYMTFHNRKVFKEAFQPKPFSYAVRRSPLHSPEGQIQIETSETTPAEPIYTVSQHTENAPLMEFALNATTTVKFGGERHLHGWMAHRFSGQALPELKFVAEARQFSSYIVLIGRIASAKLFQPKYGFIVQNKDEFRIPLDLEQIPTAKEFKDAISSLSPEQQRFAKAFRSMQLESTLFGVCVIQIKPQLEKVLKLQADSLTKEIKLTQDLMQLFIKYQIPTDLLSFQGTGGAGAEGEGGAQGLLAVKGHAQALQEVLLSAKEEEVAEAKLNRGLKRGREEEESSEEESEDEEEAGDMTIYSSRRIGGRTRQSARSAYSVRYSCGGQAPQLASVSTRKSAPATGGVRSDDDEDDEADPVHYDQSEEEISERQASDLSGAVDFTVYPNKLEEMYMQYDPTSSLRPTIINTGSEWEKTSQAGLLSKPATAELDSDDQKTEKNAAFDLLDALTRSGALPIEHASLHVIIAATHCFDDDLMDTVVQKNVNPIERVERSTLIMAAALHGLPASALVSERQLERVSMFSPMLFPAAEGADMLTNE